MKLFEEKAMKAWGLELWEGVDDPDTEVIFFGLFHDRDFEVFHNFKGKKLVFWCGGDILRLIEDYERQRVIRINPAIHYCENEIEAENLRKVGIEPVVIPSFLGSINHYPISFKMPEGRWKIWMCAHDKRETEYGVDKAREIAKMFDNVEIHIYGVDKPTYREDISNVIYHGFVSENKLDEEIKKYHCGLRCNEHDGVSEVVIKSALLGQYIISRIPYDGVWHYETFGDLAELVAKLTQQTSPNYEGRTTWIKKINQYPFNKNKMNFYEEE